MDQLPETIACPYCGNINPYLQDNCIKCKKPLGPIRDVMQGGSSLENKETIEELAKPKEPAPTIPELPPRPVEAKTGKFIDTNAFLIRGMGARANEIAARLFKQLAVRNIQNLKLSFGKIVIELQGNKKDTREYYFAECDLGDGALAIMAIRINPVGTDLFIEWRNYTLPSYGPIAFSWGWFTGGLLFGLFPGILYGLGYIIYLLLYKKPSTSRKSDLEGFQFQENQAFQLSVRAALEEAIDLAGISKSFIQEISKDEKKDRVI